MSEDNPMTRAQAATRPVLPKRFYDKAAAVGHEGEQGSGFAIHLDGRPLRTPAKALLILPDADLADAVAAEWQAQTEVVDPATMPLTRLANSALDTVAADPGAVAREAARYAGSDLLCYRAEEPDGLVERQNEAWDPVLDWARADLGLRFNLAGGIVHVGQPDETLARVETLLAGYAPLPLAGLHVITSLTGSVVLALAVAEGRLDAEAAWSAACVDEDWQISQWGEDAEAMKKRSAAWRDMEAASRLARLR